MKFQSIIHINRVNSLQIFQVLQFGAAIIIGIFLAKSGVETGEISIYEALMFIGALFCFFWIAGGTNSFLQLFPKLKTAEQKSALFNIFILFLGIGFFVGMLLFLSSDFVASGLTKFSKLPFIELLALYIFINSPSNLIPIYYLLLKRYREVVVFGAISFSLQILLVIVPVIMGYGIEGIMWGLIVWALIKLIWVGIILLKHASFELAPLFWKMYLPLLLPLLLLSLIGKGSEFVNGLAVSLLFEEENAFAVYRYGAREFPLAVLMVGALATSLLPLISENLDKGLSQIRSTTKALSHWLFPMSMLTMLLSPILFPVIFNPDFAESARVFNIFTLVLSSRILLPQVVILSQQGNYFLTLTAFIELVILGSLSFWLGGPFGLEGVAAALVIAFLVERAILITYAWRVLGISPNRYIDWKIWTTYSILLYTTFGISLYIR